MGVFSVYFGVDALTALKESQCFFLSGFFSEKTPLSFVMLNAIWHRGPRKDIAPVPNAPNAILRHD